MNDSLRTNVFVRFQAETIACACIYLAARALQVEAPLTAPHPTPKHVSVCLNVCWALLNVSLFPQIALPSRPHWYLLFGATEEEIKEICLTTLKLYTRKKVSQALACCLLSSLCLKIAGELDACGGLFLRYALNGMANLKHGRIVCTLCRLFFFVSLFRGGLLTCDCASAKL